MPPSVQFTVAKPRRVAVVGASCQTTKSRRPLNHGFTLCRHLPSIVVFIAPVASAGIMSYAYFCMLHPQMKGIVEVTRAPNGP
jgi:hypothetical protein